MKVITINQPWATLISEGYKEYEFRTWKTNYRGEIYIHAGKKTDKEAMKKFEHLNLKYPISRIIAKTELEDCVFLTEEINQKISKKNPLIYGTKSRTGYAFKLKNTKKIKIDKEIKGQLGIWNNIEE